MHTLKRSMVPVMAVLFSVGAVTSAHAEGAPRAEAGPGLAAQRAQRVLGTREFRAFLRNTPGMRKTHAWSLVRATADTVGWTAVAAITGILTGSIAAVVSTDNRPTQMAGMLLVAGLASAGTILGTHGAHVKNARTETIAEAVAGKKLEPSIAEKSEKAGVINSDWR